MESKWAGRVDGVSEAKILIVPASGLVHTHFVAAKQRHLHHTTQFQQCSPTSHRISDVLCERA